MPPTLPQNAKVFISFVCRSVRHDPLLAQNEDSGDEEDDAEEDDDAFIADGDGYNWDFDDEEESADVPLSQAHGPADSVPPVAQVPNSPVNRTTPVAQVTDSPSAGLPHGASR